MAVRRDSVMPPTHYHSACKSESAVNAHVMVYKTNLLFFGGGGNGLQSLNWE